MRELLDIKKMNQTERPNFCPRCGEKLISINVLSRDYSVVEDAYRKCPCGWKKD
ncbi:MAG: hypothetical protein GWO87_00195 [Xanthomonadaceae bacterium]|nr:hypothetical protein [Rhodospirillaceae bacterium]NIA17600.1 hypothetical protein [Xanthomonadaceae bacterium]